MTGIPVKIWRDGQEENIYLSTRRSGESGDRMRVLKRAFRKAMFQASKESMRVALVLAKVQKLDTAATDYGEQLTALLQDQEQAMEASLAHKDKALEAALELVEIALKENHGPETDAIMDCLTDTQVQQCVAIIETGETPADFFQSRATRPSVTTTTPGAGKPGASSLTEGTPGTISKPEKSA